MRSIVNLLNEIRQLERTPRTGFEFLGSGKQSVAEHSYNATMICYVLADLSEEPVNLERLLMLVLCHDIPEARTGDLNYVYKRYGRPDEKKAIAEIESKTSAGKKIAEYVSEFQENKTLEAKLAHDADQLELLLALKRLFDIGNPRAMDWFDLVQKRVHTSIGQRLAEEIRQTPFDEWWIEKTKCPHWEEGEAPRMM